MIFIFFIQWQDIFDGFHGAGDSSQLKEKSQRLESQMLTSQNKEVCFVIGSGSEQQSLFHSKLEEMWSGQYNITIKKFTKGEVSNAVLSNKD